MPEATSRYIRKEFKKLQLSYIQKLPNLAAEIASSWKHYLDAPSRDGLEQLERQFHAICGTAAILSIPSISDLAQHLEQRFAGREQPDSLAPHEHLAATAEIGHFIRLATEGPINIDDTLP